MRSNWQPRVCSIVSVALGIGLTFSASRGAEVRTFAGEVSDAMCGAQHMMEGSKADCARACVGKGSKYALVVGNTVYTLDSSDKKILDQLNRLAGEKATVSGAADGDTIKVSSVVPSK
jgi:hypothetical protein